MVQGQHQQAALLELTEPLYLPGPGDRITLSCSHQDHGRAVNNHHQPTPWRPIDIHCAGQAMAVGAGWGGSQFDEIENHQDLQSSSEIKDPAY